MLISNLLLSLYYGLYWCIVHVMKFWKVLLDGSFAWL